MRNLLLLLLLLNGGYIWGQSGGKAEVIRLDTGWYFSRGGEGKWLEAKVPGIVQQDLIRHGLLPDPFYGLNEQKIQWVEKEDWEYKTTFRISREQLARKGILLCFDGLDTYADVYLNGARILQGDNMFVGYKIPVKELLREGENHLHIYFHSPVTQTLAQGHSNGFEYPADNDHGEQKLSIFTRKAPYSYGWDWGIRMVTSGIWRPVTLIFNDGLTIDDFCVRQLSLTDKLAKLVCDIEVNHTFPFVGETEVRVEWTLPGRDPRAVCRTVAVAPGSNRWQVPVEIPAPERWMPNGWGKPVLYDFKVYVLAGRDTLAIAHRRVGLRTLRVVREKDPAGESFYFEVNGIPLFAKGANYIPADAMLPAMTDERYRLLFQDIKDAHMNMIRVWGGGTYEDDRFYDLADENGILVWQDFMFACTTYPHDPLFLQRVKEEAEYNVRRLRNHACLAMWCGNNEIAEGLQYWGWKKKYSPSVYASMQKGYRIIFRELLPDIVTKLDSGRYYMHGSPDMANWGRPESWGTGDSHNWGVWYGQKKFESLDQELPRFMSEFGFQSLPAMKTIATFAVPEDYYLESAVMNAHQKSSIGNDLIRKYMERDFIVPEKFEDFVYVGLVLQGRGIRHGLEAHRRNRPYCMGTLYWQLNDSWPVVSWSGIDYYGNWKALHYQAKRAFAPLIVDAVQQGEQLQIWLISDELENRKDLTLEIQLTDFKGKVGDTYSLKVEALANSAGCVWEKALQEVIREEHWKDRYLLLTLKDRDKKIIFREPYFLVAPKNLDLPDTKVTYRVLHQENGSCKVGLRTRQLTKDVFVEVPFQGARFSDNFFDLLPEEEKIITITAPQMKKNDPVLLQIKHLRETY